jgi:hypothetical protein
MEEKNSDVGSGVELKKPGTSADKLQSDRLNVDCSVNAEKADAEDGSKRGLMPMVLLLTGGILFGGFFWVRKSGGRG